MLEILCPEKLEAARAFAESVGLKRQLEESLAYLDDYGNIGLPKDAPGRREHRCVLSHDFAAHSFGVDMYGPKSDGSGDRYLFSGALIYQGPTQPADGSFPSLTVSLHSKHGWFLHT